MLDGAGSTGASVGSAQQQVVAPDAQHFKLHTKSASFRIGMANENTCTIRKTAVMILVQACRIVSKEKRLLCQATLRDGRSPPYFQLFF
jgi:hypothetical protein